MTHTSPARKKVKSEEPDIIEEEITFEEVIPEYDTPTPPINITSTQPQQTQKIKILLIKPSRVIYEDSNGNGVSVPPSHIFDNHKSGDIIEIPFPYIT